ncbi:MAG: EVE domain-containing protein [Candidatus Altiarchaeota archaeon]|nr:EVE domain-containing protein [Candidatus Altiarchaeota archaeon]
MNYYIDLFSPETAIAFEKSDKSISGFRISRKTYVENQKIGPGDKFICYVTRLQRFVGVLEVKSKPFQDAKPIFIDWDDPFVLRFNVEPIVWLPLEKSIPIHSDFIWNNGSGKTC